jgi:hypothetical protein
LKREMVGAGSRQAEITMIQVGWTLPQCCGTTVVEGLRWAGFVSPFSGDGRPSEWTGMTHGPVLGDCRTDGWLTRPFSDDSGSESRSDAVTDEFRVIVEVSTLCKLSLLALLSSFR